MAQEFRIVVVIDPKGAKAGAGEVEKSLKRTTTAADALRSRIRQALGFTALTLAVRRAVSVLASFEQEMATVRAITGATEQQFAALREEAQRLGANTRFSATQAAQGLTFLARAGFTAQESLDALEGTLLLAQAGNLELARAADISTNVLKAFRLEVSDLAMVVDVLALAANSSNTDVNQLGDAIKLVGPIAAGVGVSLQETTAAIGALSNAGLQATLAGTGLRRVIAELEAPTDSTRAILEQLGVSAEQVQVSQVGLTAALQRLADAGIDTGTALQIFGQRGGPAFEILRNSIGDVEGMTEALNGAGGTARRVADIMDDNLNGALLAVRSAAEAVILALGDEGGAGGLTAGLRGLAAFLRFVAENADVLGAALSALTIGLLTRLLPATVLTSGGLTALATSAGAATAAFLTNPFTVFVAGATTAFVTFKRLTDALDEAVEAERRATEGLDNTPIFNANEELRKATENLERLEAAAKRNGAAFEQQISAKLEDARERVAAANKEIERIKGNTDAARRAAEAHAEAIDRVNLTFNQEKQALEDSNRLLQENAREREVQTRLLELQNKLNEEQAGATPEQLAELEALIRRNQVLQDQANLLDELNGPQAEFEARLAAAQALLDAGKISAEQFAEALKATATDFPEFDIPGFDPSQFGINVERPSIAGSLSELEREAELLNLSADARAREVEVRRIADSLRTAGIDLYAEENAGALAAIQAQLQQNEQLRLQSELLEEIKGPREEQAAAQAALNQLYADGKITLDEYTAALERLGQKNMEVATGIEGGIARAVDNFGANLKTAADVSDQVFTAALNRTSDALTEFVTTGQLDFKEFARSLIADIVRIVAKLLILKALEAASGIPGLGALGGSGARQLGGQVDQSRAFLVGENGPELFQPPSQGRIVPARETERRMAAAGQQAAPQVTVQNQPPPVSIINQLDSREVVSAGLATPEGEEMILNIIQKNRQSVKTTLA